MTTTLYELIMNIKKLSVDQMEILVKNNCPWDFSPAFRYLCLDDTGDEQACKHRLCCQCWYQEIEIRPKELLH